MIRIKRFLLKGRDHKKLIVANKFKVTHYTWIKFIKSRRNGLITKNKHMRYRNGKKANEKSIIRKNSTFKNLFQ